MSIKIPVQADFDSASVEQQLQQFQSKLNALGQQIAQANKTKFEPIGKTTLSDLQKVTQQFEALRRVSNDLNKRINATGQKGASFVDLDWSKLYPDQSSRSRQMAKAFQYVTGANFAPGPGGGGKPPPAGPTWSQVGFNAVSAGLNATGSAGRVASGALGTGMSAGFGAGMMGLLGGIIALGVGKAVGAVSEHIGRAEQNNIDLDKLKRTLGDVGVSFDQLKAAVHGSANVLGITFDEAGKLAQQFAKLANLSGENGLYGAADGVQTGVGLSRSFGLDPSQGVGVLGSMRGLGITRNEQDTRKFALLIGETIGKSDAFAKSDEVMEALASFLTNQTRATLGRGNAAGYAGMFAGLASSGIPGLDPAGAGSLLSRVNAALTAGGAKGEASQFFTARLGASRGMDVFDTQLWREGGAFSTADSTFGGDGAVSRFYEKYGLKKPGGSQSLLSANLDQLRREYGKDPKMMLMATANQMGLSMSQAAALHVVDPKAMGEMEKYGNVRDFNASGIGNLSKALSGTAADRQAMMQEFLARTGKDKLSNEDAALLRSKKDNDAELRDVLAKLSVKYGQEETTGSIARDSKALLENIKTSIADKLVPYVNDMREGILYLAGNREKTGIDVLKEIAEKGSAYRKNRIEAEYDTRGLITKRAGLQTQFDGINEGRLKDKLRAGIITPEQYQEQMRAKQKLQEEMNEVDKQIKDISEKKKALLEEEVKRLERERASIDERGKAQIEIENATANPPVRGGGAGGGGGGGGGGRQLDTSSIDGKLAEAERRNGLPAGVLRAVMQQETGGRQGFLDDPSAYHYGLNANGQRIAPHTGKVSTAFGPFGILESTGRSPGYGVSPLKDKSIDEQIRFASEYLAARTRSAGSLAGGLAGYGEGFAYSNSVMNKMRAGTPMPQEAAASRMGDQQMNLRGGFDPLTITIQDQNGKPLAPTQSLNPYFNRPSAVAQPFGR